MLTDFKKSLEQMNASFKSDAKSVVNATKCLDKAIGELKGTSLKKEFRQIDQLKSTIKLIEKLSIVNDYKLNLFKNFSSYLNQKK